MIVSIRDLMPIIKESFSQEKPVRFPSTGSSMMPFIRNNDVVELIPYSHKSTSLNSLCKGSIVLLEKEENVFIIHRIVKLSGNTFYLRGDAQRVSEGPFDLNSIIGIVNLSLHKSGERNHLLGFWKFAGKFWVSFFPLTIYTYDSYRFLRRFAGIILRKLHLLPQNN